jgi:hypothetical protein
MDALLAYSDDDDDNNNGCNETIIGVPPAANRALQHSNTRLPPPPAKAAGVVVFRLPSARSASVEDSPPPQSQPDDAGAKRPRDGDRKTAFLSSLPAPKHSAKTSLLSAGGAAVVAEVQSAPQVAPAADEDNFEVDAAAYSDADGSGNGSEDCDPSPPPACRAAQSDADDQAPSLGPSYPPPDCSAFAYPEVQDFEPVQEQFLDYSNPIFDQSVPVEGAVKPQPSPSTV